MGVTQTRPACRTALAAPWGALPGQIGECDLSAHYDGDDNPAVVQRRASDADRDRALAKLTEGFAAGRMTQETFTLRVDAALRARVTGELRGLAAGITATDRIAPPVHYRPGARMRHDSCGRDRVALAREPAAR